MKLIIQIPCFNEEKTLPETLRDLPRSIPGIDQIEVLVVDDGSSDNTAEVARAHGVHHVLALGTNRGLASAFAQGIEHAVLLGADIVVNTDADNQYCGADIGKLVKPIMERKADFVVGCRPIMDHPEFSPLKKLLQRLGSWMLRQVSKTDVRDAASGFRAFSREACKRLYIHSRFSYCMETLIQAGNSRLRVASVDIGVNRATRPSRLFRSIPEYLWKSGSTMVAMFILYRPGRFFGILSSLCLTAAFVIGLRYIYLIYLFPPEAGTKIYHIPSLILASIFALAGVMLAALGVIGELIRALRSQLDETLFQIRKLNSIQVGGPVLAQTPSPKKSAGESTCKVIPFIHE
ncbi:MAG TPA: glycosyltransferase family 2 protein [Candidatus Paceibacterota bacterium]|nr:glycosyltransferase family 2 protein [Candidatus Paceibacterota bacterium]